MKKEHGINLYYQKLSPEGEARREDVVAHLELCRPEAANSLNHDIVSQMTVDLAAIAANPMVRALVVTGRGKNFCAGGDLNWMRRLGTLPFEENVKEAQNLGQCFRQLHELPVPTIAFVQGAAFAGATGLIACCDAAVGEKTSRFCLSEARLGFAAAIILPFLSGKVAQGALRDWVLTGKEVNAEEALNAGLITQVASPKIWQSVLKTWLSGVLKGEPKALADFKCSHREGVLAGWQAPDFSDAALAEKLARGRASQTAQEGILAFFDKKPPSWAISLSADWQLEGLTNI